MNPKGWKFGNELYTHEEDAFFSEVPVSFRKSENQKTN